METLGFYPLTVILTYLGENDGVCLLLTKKYYAKQILPLFRWNMNTGLVVVNDRKQRHRFQVSPVQAPVVLLQRLNTRRLGKRKRPPNGEPPFRFGMSTMEVANHEWEQSRQNYTKNQGSSKLVFSNPPSLELLRFLDQLPKQSSTKRLDDFLLQSGITLLVSYPRSGNTLLRTLFERTTGMVTGSDTRPDRSLSKALAEAHNLVGEGVTQQSKTCFVKTHWPERVGCRVFRAHRVVLIVRNPFDAIDSYWNLNATNTHTDTVTEDVYLAFMDVFEDLARNEIKVWCEFHQFWLDKSRIDNLPLLLIRFEDLIQQPQVIMTQLLEFMSGSSSPLGLFWQQRIAHAATTSEEHNNNNLGSYTPRTATRGIKSVGKSIQKQRYSEELLQYFHAVAAEAAAAQDGNENLLQKFGYDIENQQFPENFARGEAPPLPNNYQRAESLTTDSSSTNFVKVNDGSLIRPKDCPFGRAMRAWRLRNTENDTNPFPTVPREK